jgi:DNA-binding NtrC family response regulator
MTDRVQSAKDLRVLIADDNTDVVEALRILLKGAGFAVTQATSPEGALAAVAREDLDVALLDMNYARDTTSGVEGLDLLSRVRSLAPDLPVVLTTAWGSVAGAVEAMKRGARDYVEKPWQNDRLLSILRVQVELRRAARQASRLGAQATREHERAMPELVTVSAAMDPVRRLVERRGRRPWSDSRSAGDRAGVRHGARHCGCQSDAMIIATRAPPRKPPTWAP